MNLSANTDLRSVEEFRDLVIRQSGGQARASARRRRRGSRRGRLRLRSAFHRRTRGVHGHLGFAERQQPRCHQARPQGNGSDSKRIADRSRRPRRLRCDKLHQRRDQRSHQDSDRNTAHRCDCHFLIPRLAAFRARSARGDSRLAHRRGFPDADFWVHAEPAHAARDRFVGRAGRR